MSGTNAGGKWFALLLIYFTVMTLVVSLVNFAYGGSFETDIGFTKYNYCDEPRDIYEPYNTEPVKNTDQLDGSDYRFAISHMDCSKSAGVLSNESCTYIEGCTWDSPPQTGFTNYINWLWNKITFTEPQEIEPTCYGSINGSYYNIETYDVFLYGDRVVLPHNNSDLMGNVGSICTHPNVTDSEELCSLFSCTWISKELISDMSVDNVKIKTGVGGATAILSSLWNTVYEMATFRFDFGIESVFVIYFLNFFMFWLPMIGLILSVYLMIRG